MLPASRSHGIKLSELHKAVCHSGAAHMKTDLAKGLLVTAMHKYGPDAPARSVHNHKEIDAAIRKMPMNTASGKLETSHSSASMMQREMSKPFQAEHEGRIAKLECSINRLQKEMKNFKVQPAAPTQSNFPLEDVQALLTDLKNIHTEAVTSVTEKPKGKASSRAKAVLQ